MRRHFWTAQYDPSGALQALTRCTSGGPSYGLQAFLNRSFRPNVPQPPARVGPELHCLRALRDGAR